MNLTNHTYGRLTALVDTGRRDSGRSAIWICQCECDGRFVEVTSRNLRVGDTQSCGCLRREKTIQRNRDGKHGHARRGQWHELYQTWSQMKQRCLNPNHDKYHLYGGRGITVCAEWKDDFEAFIAHVGDRPIGKTLDRVNPDGNYQPGNVRWATSLEQRRNRSHV